MAVIMQIDTAKATSNPESVFADPGEIVGHIGLTRGQKVSALQRWAFDLRARIDAVSEGMNGHQEGAYTRDVALLRTVERLLEEVASAQPQ